MDYQGSVVVLSERWRSQKAESQSLNMYLDLITATALQQLLSQSRSHSRLSFIFSKRKKNLSMNSHRELVQTPPPLSSSWNGDQVARSMGESARFTHRKEQQQPLVTIERKCNNTASKISFKASFNSHELNSVYIGRYHMIIYGGRCSLWVFTLD